MDTSLCYAKFSMTREKSQYDKEKIILTRQDDKIKGGFALYLASQKASYKASKQSP